MQSLLQLGLGRPIAGALSHYVSGDVASHVSVTASFSASV